MLLTGRFGMGPARARLALPPARAPDRERATLTIDHQTHATVDVVDQRGRPPHARNSCTTVGLDQAVAKRPPTGAMLGSCHPRRFRPCPLRPLGTSSDATPRDSADHASAACAGRHGVLPRRTRTDEGYKCDSGFGSDALRRVAPEPRRTATVAAHDAAPWRAPWTAGAGLRSDGGPTRSDLCDSASRRLPVQGSAALVGIATRTRRVVRRMPSRAAAAGPRRSPPPGPSGRDKG